MITAIVPAKNEVDRISTVLNHLLFVGITKIVVVANGCDDGTEDLVLDKYPTVQLLSFKQSLGIDIPKAVGCAWAVKQGATDFLFYDGDMIGEITTELSLLISNHLKSRNDLTLSNCYPTPTSFDALPRQLYFPRAHLNQLLGLFDSIGISTPSHGPHIINKSILNLIDIKDIGVPPVILAKAAKSSCKIAVGIDIPHVRLGSKIKNGIHSKLIIDTFWGDCAEGISIYLGLPRNRFLFGKEYDGYNSQRRFDLLDSYLETL